MHYLDELDLDSKHYFKKEMLHYSNYNILVSSARYASSVASKYACKQLKYTKESSLKPISRDYFACKVKDELFIDHLSVDKHQQAIFDEVESKHSGQEYDDPMFDGFKCDLWLAFKHLITKCRFVSVFGLAGNASHGPVFIFTKVLYHLIRLGYAQEDKDIEVDECLSQSLKLIGLQSVLTEDDFPSIGILDPWKNDSELFAIIEHTYMKVQNVVKSSLNSSTKHIDKGMLDIILSCARAGIIVSIIVRKEKEERISILIRDFMFDYIKRNSPLPRTLCAYFIIVLCVCDFFDMEKSRANLEHFHGRVKVEYVSSTKSTKDHKSIADICNNNTNHNLPTYQKQSRRHRKK